MASETDICNLALGNIKAGRINSLDDDSAEGRACKLRYPQARDTVLQGAYWNFAAKTATLARLTTTPDEWEYQYTLPTDFLAARYITPDSKSRYHGDHIEYEIGIDSAGNKVLMTNLLDARLRYTMKQTGTGLFSPLFVEALSWWLAATLAIPIVGAATGRELRKEALEIYTSMLGSAIAANETDSNPGDEHRDPDMIRARDGVEHIHDHRRPL